ncbi:MAG: LytTR family transcriptional regulator [Lachnospiraceae bacterium]|nr:LytTR family transcriptional regulator [Lachnospiraceae bacterium]
MKIRLLVRETHREEITEKLEKAGFQIDDEAPFLLSETQVHPAFLSLRDSRGERVRLAVEDIIFIESYGRRVEVHTAQGSYQAADRLYQLAEMLDPGRFLRISNSVIIARRHVKKIRPALSLKFVLTLSDGTVVDVTRSYYSAFREFFNI